VFPFFGDCCWDAVDIHDEKNIDIDIWGNNHCAKQSMDGVHPSGSLVRWWKLVAKKNGTTCQKFRKTLPSVFIVISAFSAGSHTVIHAKKTRDKIISLKNIASNVQNRSYLRHVLVIVCTNPKKTLRCHNYWRFARNISLFCGLGAGLFFEAPPPGEGVGPGHTYSG